jgi:hypothetical protein
VRTTQALLEDTKDNQDLISRTDKTFFFTTMSKPVWGPFASYLLGPWGKMTAHLHLAPRLKIHRALSPFLLHKFMQKDKAQK